MANANGFWSYVHDDDEAEGGRIANLANDVVARYNMITGESIELFLDRDSIDWGEDWRERVDRSLATVAFFIPVITPRYFQSPECRRELAFFSERAVSLGVRELVLPILYVDVATLHVEPLEDEAMKTVKSFQWEDWTDTAFEDRGSETYRRAVARLAQRLAAANEEAERVDVAAAAASMTNDGADADDDTAGSLDILAMAEEALPGWTETVREIGEQIEVIGGLMRQGTADMQRADNTGQGFAGRLTATRRLSRQLAAPADRISELSQEFTQNLNAVDAGVRLIISQATGEAGEDDEARMNICKFFSNVESLSVSMHNGLGSTQRMIDAIAPIEAVSRDMRPVLRTLRRGLTLMMEGRKVVSDWQDLIRASEINCE